MASSTQGQYPAIPPMTAHVLHHLARHRSPFPASPPPPPLFVAVQGPQGSGKTFLTSHLHTTLSAAPHTLHVAVLSIDDLYLPHDALRALADAHPRNAMLTGRGPPGTHDLELGTAVLNRLKEINDTNGATSSDAEPSSSTVTLPVFDKSLHGGYGDRLPPSAWRAVPASPPLDVVILEGWCVGFAPVTPPELVERWSRPVEDVKDIFKLQELFRREDVEEINGFLAAYESWWRMFDVFIQIAPPDAYPHAYIYEWRLQQEHAMKAKNNGQGMSDEQVKAFVDRYIPGYVFFQDGIVRGFPAPAPESGSSTGRTPPSWTGRGLRVVIGREREVLETQTF